MTQTFNDAFFSNGTGVRCHVAGWGKDEFTGNFQFIQHKVDIPLMDDFRCNAALKLALNRRQRGVGDRSAKHSQQILTSSMKLNSPCDAGSSFTPVRSVLVVRLVRTPALEMGAPPLCVR